MTVPKKAPDPTLLPAPSPDAGVPVADAWLELPLGFDVPEGPPLLVVVPFELVFEAWTLALQSSSVD
jgi:hypothetical protein